MDFKASSGSPGNWGCPLMAHFVKSFVCLFVLFYWERSCFVAQTGCELVAIVPPQPLSAGTVAMSHLTWRTMPWGTLYMWTCLVRMRVDTSLTPLYLFIYCICSLSVHAHTCAKACMWRSEDNFRTRVSPSSPVWVLRVELWLSPLVASTFTYWAVSTALTDFLRITLL